MKSFFNLLSLVFANTIFLVTSYGVYVNIATYFKPELYGIFNVVMGLIICLEYFITNFIPKAVQSAVAKFPENMVNIKKIFLPKQIMISLAIFLFFFICADGIAKLLNDYSLAIYIRLALFDILIHAIYVFFIAFYYGLGLFGYISLSVCFLGILRFLIVIFIISLSLPFWAIFIGYFFASLLGAIFVIIFFPKKSNIDPVIVSYPIIPFAYMGFFQLALYFLSCVDLFFVKRLVTDSTKVGIYSSAFCISRGVFYVFCQVGAFIFPFLSKALYVYDKNKIEYYLNIVNIIILFILLPVGLGIYFFSGKIIKFLLPLEYCSAEYILSLLGLGTIGMVIFAIFSEIINIINARISFVVVLLLLSIEILLCNFLIKSIGTYGAAISVFITGVMGAMISVIVTYILLKNYLFSRVK